MYIDINDIPDLRHISKTNDSLTIGGNLSLTAVMETFNKYSNKSNFEYLKHLADHIDLIASVPVRNVCIRVSKLSKCRKRNCYLISGRYVSRKLDD